MTMLLVRNAGSLPAGRTRLCIERTGKTVLHQRQRQLLARLGDLTDLPSLPNVASDLIWKLNDPDTGIADVTGPLSQDPALAGQMLKMVNSAYYGVRQEVTSLSQAITLLGYRTVQTVVLSAAAKGVFRLRCKSPRFDQEAMTLHSIAAAAVARHLARTSRKVNPDLAFSVGLLHDIGKLAIDQVAPDHYTTLFDDAKEQETDLLAAEKSTGSCGHCVAAAQLGDHWRLPSDIVDGIGHHHTMASAENADMTAVMLITDYICQMKQLGAPDNFSEPQLDREAWSAVGIPSTELAPMLSGVDEHIAQAREIFAL